MITSKVNIGEVKATNLRIDASYHLSEGQEIKRVIRSSPYGLLSIQDVCSNIFIGNRARRVYVTREDKGIRFLSSSDILLADLESVKLASVKYTPNIDQMRLQKGWTLISRSGTIGNCAFSNRNHAEKLSSEHVLRCVPNGKIKEGLVYAYLASKFGHSLLTQGTFGAVIQHIEPEYVASLPIPSFPDDFQILVDTKMQESALLREKAAAELKSAISCFEDGIGHCQYSYKYKTKAVKSSSVSSRFTRFDSQYQIGKIELDKDLSYKSCVKIGDVSKSIYVGNRGKRYYVKEGIPFLSSSDMMLFNPIKYSTPISVNTPNLEGLLVHTDDILISRSGTIGNTVIVSDTLNGKAVSEHALRLVIDPDKMDPKYVFCYLNTAHGKRVLESLAYGSVIITLGEEFVANIDLPLLSKEAKDTISAKIKQYSSLLDEATRLENEAVSLVEAEIEKWNN